MGFNSGFKGLRRCNTFVGADESVLPGKVEDDVEVNMNNWSVVCRFLYNLCLF